MIDDLVTDLYRRAAAVWGRNAQIDMAIEEMAELTVELQHTKRGRADRSAVQAEIADVLIMAEQLRLMFGADEVDGFKLKKILRLSGRVERAEASR